MTLGEFSMNLGLDSVLYALAGGIILIGAFLAHSKFNSPSRLAKKAYAKLPPGPPADPIIGHLRRFPKEEWYKTFTLWQKEFG